MNVYQDIDKFKKPFDEFITKLRETNDSSYDFRKDETKLQLVMLVGEQLGSECLDDMYNIYEHGIGGGYHGFIYYTETSDFFDNNQELIVDYLTDLAQDCYGKDETMFTVFGKESLTMAHFKNNCAWAIGEEISRYICDMDSDDFEELLANYDIATPEDDVEEEIDDSDERDEQERQWRTDRKEDDERDEYKLQSDYK